MVDRVKAEEIVRLKAKYGVSSQDAFKYLRTQADYESLRDRLAEEIPGFVIPVRHVSNLCAKANVLAKQALDTATFLAIDRRDRTGLDKLLENELYVPPYLPYEEEIETYRTEVGFDYVNFILDYVTNLSLDSRTNAKMSVAIAFSEAVRNLVNGEHPYFKIGGESLSFQDLMGREDILLDRSRIHPPEDEEDYSVSLEYLSERARGLSIAGSSSEKLFDHLAENPRAIPEDCRVSLVMDDLNKVTTEELNYLYSGRDFYARALEDQTTRRIETERRMGLLSVIPGFKGTDPNTHIENKIKELNELIINRRARLSRLVKLLAPSSIIRNEHHMIDMAVYEMVAIKKNRAWIREALPRIDP